MHQVILSIEQRQNFIRSSILQQRDNPREKEIETELYALLLNYFQQLLVENGEVGEVNYRSPHHIDGLLTISTTENTQRIIIEAKTHRSLLSTGIWAPLAQALQYTRLLSHLGELLPGVILISTESEWHAVQVDSLTPLLSRDDLPWESAPSARSSEIEEALRELNPSILSYAVGVKLDLNDTLGAISFLLRESNHSATKQHGSSMAQLSVAIEVDPTTYIYHIPGSRWWRYQWERGLWSPVEPRALTMELREQASNSGTHLRGLSSLVRSAVEEAKTACAMEQWPYSPGLINTPLGSWNAMTGSMTSSIPEHGHRYSTGPLVEMAAENQESPSIHAILLSRAMGSVSGISRDNLILGVIPDSIVPSALISLYIKALGSYAMVGTHRDILSQWRWSPSAGDAPILLAVFDAVQEDKAMGQVLQSMERQSRFHDACAILIIRESQYSSLAIGTVDRVDAVVDLTKEEILDTTLMPSLLSCSLGLMGESVEIPRYKNENNDIMLSWFNNSFKTSPYSFITIEDLWASYNEYATSRGNAAVSMRYFVESLTNHSVFSDNRLVHKKSARILKGLNRSRFAPLDNTSNQSRELGTHATYIVGIEFTPQ